MKAAKVIGAHAGGVGDPLLGVPLHCAAGLYSDAVALLQVSQFVVSPHPAICFHLLCGTPRPFF